jgi:hypothetical protein
MPPQASYTPCIDLLPLLIMTFAIGTATLPITDCVAGDEVESQLAVRFDIVVTLIEEDGHATTGLTTVLDNPVGQCLDLVAWHTASALKESADAALSEFPEADTEAHDELPVLVPAAVGDVADDLLTQPVSHVLAEIATAG